MVTSISELQEQIYRMAVEKGWWEKPRTGVENVALCHSELSEALEELRDGHDEAEHYYKAAKPEGYFVELADVVIRILDYAGGRGVNMEAIIEEKVAFNATRSVRHGGKVL